MDQSSRENTDQRAVRRRVSALAVVATGSILLGTIFLSTGGGAAAPPTTIKVVQNKTWGPTLALKNGDTLYRLTKDSKNKSVCTGKCATIWIPVTLAVGQSRAVGVGVKGLGSLMRANGSHQVTLDGIPLYRFTGDTSPGAVTGNVKDTWGQWWSINPKSPTRAPTKKTGGGGGRGTTTTTTTAPAGGGVAY